MSITAKMNTLSEVKGKEKNREKTMFVDSKAEPLNKINAL